MWHAFLFSDQAKNLPDFFCTLLKLEGVQVEIPVIKNDDHFNIYVR